MDYISQLTERYPILKVNEKAIRDFCDALIRCYEWGGKLLICGNGGSCADAEHIAGELMKGFLKTRPLSEERKAQMTADVPALEGINLGGLQHSQATALTVPTLRGQTLLHLPSDSETRTQRKSLPNIMTSLAITIPEYSVRSL